MRILLAAAIVIAALSAVFALQNARPVSVSFLSWSFEASLVIVLLMTFSAGALAAFLVSVPWRIKVLRELSELRKKSAERAS